MYTAMINNCCGAKLIYGFGRARNTATYGDQPNTYHGHRNELIKKLEGLKAGGINIAIAFTNDLQKRAEEALEDCGFSSTDPMEGNHYDTKIKLWWRGNIKQFKKEDCKDRTKVDEEDEDK